jgi:hypothetical protein
MSRVNTQAVQPPLPHTSLLHRSHLITQMDNFMFLNMANNSKNSSGSFAGESEKSIRLI